MKKALLALLLILVLFVCKSCSWLDEDFEDQFSPTILDRTAFENSVKILPNQIIINSGKIYIKDNLIFISDVNKGFQVYDYADPEKPIALGFIQILGATDLAVRDKTIYINQAVDLVTLEYNSSTNSIVVLHRNKNVFPQKSSPIGTLAKTTENQIVVDWKKR